MPYILNETELPVGRDITAGEGDTAIRFSYASMLMWSDEERAALGITWQEPPPVEPGPPVVPEEISDRQLAQAVALQGLITQDEALAWVGPGTIPAAMAAIVDAIEDATERFTVKMLLTGATIFQRHHPATLALVAAWGMSDEDAADALWTGAAAL